MQKIAGASYGCWGFDHNESGTLIIVSGTLIIASGTLIVASGNLMPWLHVSNCNMRAVKERVQKSVKCYSCGRKITGSLIPSISEILSLKMAPLHSVYQVPSCIMLASLSKMLTYLSMLLILELVGNECRADHVKNE